MTSTNANPNFNGHPLALVDHALGYARRGWSIIPVIGKKPAGLWMPFQTCPADEKTLHCLFAKSGVSGLAVVTGRVSGGLAVRDYDDDGAYHAWAEANPDDANALPTVQTARGFHVYGRLDEEGFADLGDGEFRADSKHYVLLPPSLHPDGPIYTWVNPLPDESGVLPRFPPSLKAQRGEKTHQPKQHIACVPQAAVGAIEATLPTGSGQRNRKVFDLARRLQGIAGLDTSHASLKAIVTEWHRRALPSIATKEFAVTWSDFQIAWVRVETPHGTRVASSENVTER